MARTGIILVAVVVHIGVDMNRGGWVLGKVVKNILVNLFDLFGQCFALIAD